MVSDDFKLNRLDSSSKLFQLYVDDRHLFILNFIFYIFQYNCHTNFNVRVHSYTSSRFSLPF